MSEFKGTPAPWHWEYYSTNELAHLVNDKGVDICSFGNDYDYYPTEGEEPNEYDKKLIENAPLLLEELKIAVKALKAVNSFGASKPIIERWKQLIQQATTI